MSKGVTRDMQVRAQEQLEKQERLVERLNAKVDAADRELRELRIELSNEQEILSYYRAHPALKEENDMVTGVRGMHASIQDQVEDLKQDELPLEVSR